MTETGEDEGTDGASFASILANVQRMREQYDSPPTGVQPSKVMDESPPLIEARSSTPLTPSIEKRSDDSDISHRKRARQEHLTTESAQITTDGARVTDSTPKPPLNAAPPSNLAQRKPIAPYSLADILVHKSQQGNPLFEDSAMKTTPWKFDSKVLCDYYVSPKVQILFLSLKYHKLRPEYLWHRLKKLNKGLSSTEVAPLDSVLRILLVVVDVESHHEIIRELLIFCVKHDMLLVLSWLFAEAGNYIVMAKQHERAPAKLSLTIKGIRGTDYQSSVVEAFTGIRRINKTDVSNLLANCKSAKNIILKSTDPLESEMSAIAGLGETKIRNLRLVFLEPFIYNKKYD